MATDESPFDDLMKRARSELPNSTPLAPGDLGRTSFEAFVALRGDARELQSSGQVRLSGAGVLGQAAELDDVGQLATLWQRCVTAVGAALEGSRSAMGRLSQDIVQRTQLLLEASPAPGSLVLNILPKSSAAAEAYPSGERSLFADDPRPLADRASEALLMLLQHASEPKLNELDQLSSEFESLGPRVATNVKQLADALVRSHFDVYAEWREPSEVTVRASFPAASAGWVSEFVAGRDLDAEDLLLVGTVRTVSDIAKWSIEGPDGLEQVDAGNLPAEVIRGTNVGAEVELLVRVRLTERPDGTVRRVLSAKEVRHVGMPRPVWDLAIEGVARPRDPDRSAIDSGPTDTATTEE
jgi:hypothetical protein